jgi:BlaI family transcriptional regulator, penicillinase repressor
VRNSAKSKAVLPTTGELRLLEVLWQLGEGTIDDIISRSGGNPPPNYKTVQTLLRIMERKKLVTHTVRGRAFVFRPQVAKSAINETSTRSFLERYFGGSRSALLLNLLEDESIHPDELKTLEELIRRRRKAIRRP